MIDTGEHPDYLLGHEHGYKDGDKGLPQVWDWDGYAFKLRGDFPDDPPSDEYVKGYSDGYYDGNASECAECGELGASIASGSGLICRECHIQRGLIRRHD